MRLPAAVVVAATLLTCACASGPRPRTVLAEGWAPAGTDPERARREALEDAKRRAVEQGAGVKVSAYSVVRDGALVAQRAVSAARGALTSYGLLGETKENGGVRVRIRAVVDPAGPTRPWPAGASAFIKGEGSVREALARAWTSAGGTAVDDPRRAEVVLRAEVRSVAVAEPRVRPFVSRRARATVWLAAGDGGTRWSVSKEAAELGIDDVDAEESASDSALRAAVAASGAPSL